MVVVTLRTKSGIGRIRWVVELPVDIHETGRSHRKVIVDDQPSTIHSEGVEMASLGREWFSLSTVLSVHVEHRLDVKFRRYLKQNWTRSCKCILDFGIEVFCGRSFY